MNTVHLESRIRGLFVDLKTIIRPEFIIYCCYFCDCWSFCAIPVQWSIVLFSTCWMLHLPALHFVTPITNSKPNQPFPSFVPILGQKWQLQPSFPIPFCSLSLTFRRVVCPCFPWPCVWGKYFNFIIFTSQILECFRPPFQNILCSVPPHRKTD